MSKIKSWIFALISAIIIFGAIVSLMLIFVPNKDIKFWITFISILLGVLGVFITSISVSGKDKHVSPKYAMIYVSCIYLILNLLAILLLYIIFVSVPVTWYLLTQVVLFILYLVSIFGLIHAHASISISSEETKKKCFARNEVVAQLERLISEIEVTPETCELRNKLLEIKDEIRFSDPMSIGNTEALENSIKNTISELEQMVKNINYNSNIDNEAINANILKLKHNIDERKRVLMLNK